MIVINYRDQRWKMRMFKRLEAAQHFGKRPDRWGLVFFLTCICIWQVFISRFSPNLICIWQVRLVFVFVLYLTGENWFFVENFVRICWFAQIWLVDNVAQQVADEDVQAGARDEPGVPGKPSQVIKSWSLWCCWFVIMMILIDDCGVVSWWSSWIKVLNQNAQTCPTHWIHEYIRISFIAEFCRLFNLALNHKGKFAT